MGRRPLQPSLSRGLAFEMALGDEYSQPRSIICSFDSSGCGARRGPHATPSPWRGPTRSKCFSEELGADGTPKRFGSTLNVSSLTPPYCGDSAAPLAAILYSRCWLLVQGNAAAVKAREGCQLALGARHESCHTNPNVAPGPPLDRHRSARTRATTATRRRSASAPSPVGAGCPRHVWRSHAAAAAAGAALLSQRLHSRRGKPLAVTACACSSGWAQAPTTPATPLPPALKGAGPFIFGGDGQFVEKGLYDGRPSWQFRDDPAEPRMFWAGGWRTLYTMFQMVGDGRGHSGHEGLGLGMAGMVATSHRRWG